jgi:hypothetical protein
MHPSQVGGGGTGRGHCAQAKPSRRERRLNTRAIYKYTKNFPFQLQGYLTGSSALLKPSRRERRLNARAIYEIRKISLSSCEGILPGPAPLYGNLPNGHGIATDYSITPLSPARKVEGDETMRK